MSNFLSCRFVPFHPNEILVSLVFRFQHTGNNEFKLTNLHTTVSDECLFFLPVSCQRCNSNLTRGVGRFREILRAVENRTTQSLRMVRGCVGRPLFICFTCYMLCISSGTLSHCLLEVFLQLKGSLEQKPLTYQFLCF